MVEYKCIEVTSDSGNAVRHKRRAPNDKPYECVEYINDGAELTYWASQGWRVVGFTNNYYLLERKYDIELGDSTDTVSGE